MREAAQNGGRRRLVGPVPRPAGGRVERLSQGRRRELGAVPLTERQAAQAPQHTVRRDRSRLRQSPALRELGRHGPARDGAGTTVRPEPRLGDSAVGYAKMYHHVVALPGLARRTDRVGIVKLADVPGVVEMIQNARAVGHGILLVGTPPAGVGRQAAPAHTFFLRTREGQTYRTGCSCLCC